jgi:lipopolysaccharide export system protein LptA
MLQQRNQMMKLFYCSAIIAFSLACVDCMALGSDREQPFHIQADGAEINESTGISVYRGRVNIDQGSMQIRADEVEIHTHDSEVIQIVARMKEGATELAHYEQRPDEGEELISADASEINYLIQEDKLYLTGRAKLYQPPNSFEGELLHYDLQRGLVNLRGGGPANDGDGRINMILEPKKD